MVFRQSDVMVGSTMRKALGSSTWRYSCGRVRPSARPAWRWPGGNASMPARNCSPMRADIYTPMDSAAV